MGLSVKPNQKQFSKTTDLIEENQEKEEQII